MDFIDIKKILDEELSTVDKKYVRRKLQTSSVKDILEEMYSTDVFSAYIYFINGYEESPRCDYKNCDNLKPVMSFNVRAFCSKSCSSNHNKDSSLIKREETCLERYGTKNVLSNKEIRNKSVNTLKEKYGRGVSDKSYNRIINDADNFVKKSKDTVYEKYGVDNISRLDFINDKKRVTYNNSKQMGNFDELYDSMRKKFSDFVSTNENINVIGINYPTEKDLDVFPNKNKNIEFSCISCSTICDVPSETYKFRLRTYNNVCSNCLGNSGKSSFAESEIVSFLKDNNINIVTNDRNIISPKEIDIFLPDYNIAIEFDGLYWHSEDKVEKTYHKEKTEECNKKGINLIHIFEDEWEYKKDIVKKRILSKLKINKSIGARKCCIKNITTSEAKLFYDTNHIQGGNYYKVNYGLIYNNNIVAAMSFNEPNITRGKQECEWELTRYCSDGNICGGASKLLKRFLNDYKPNTIISFSDNRWNTGDLYEKLGFKYVNETALNYWYIKGKKRYHRYGFNKSKLIKEGFDPNKSENEIMRERGFNKIWDCGSTKWKWTNL